MSADYSAIVAVREVKVPLSTETLFDINHDDSFASPIDQFIENSVRLNKLWTGKDPSAILEAELGVLLVLGYVSAVESYLRALIRKTVSIDPYSQGMCEALVLSYAAARHHRTDMLPEALLEETVFSGAKGVKDGLRKFLGLDLKEKKILELLEKYGKVCELRHCCVHRFGKLGAKNAIQLGLEQHKAYLEKPMRIRVSDMATIADLLFVLVKSLNNEIFRFVLERSATVRLASGTALGLGWTWKKPQDKRRYRPYYLVFASQLDATPSKSMDELYERFRNAFHLVGKAKTTTTE